MRKNLNVLNLILALLLTSPLAYASWMEHTNVRYEDLDGDFIKEIIIECKHGAGSNHYIEDLRIFKDTYPELKLIFHTYTLDETFGFFDTMKQYNCAIVSEVEFTEPNIENFKRDIIVKSKKVYYKDGKNQIIDKIEPLGTKIYTWNGKKFVESKSNKCKP